MESEVSLCQDYFIVNLIALPELNSSLVVKHKDQWQGRNIDLDIFPTVGNYASER